MNTHTSLTAAQKQTLEFVIEYAQHHQSMPSLRSIANGIGIAIGSVRKRINYLISKGYLIKEGTHLMLDKEMVSRHTSLLCDTDDRAENHGIPIVGKVAAGSPILAEENIEGYLELSSLAPKGDCFVLQVQGDSMNLAGILDGDYLVIESTAEVQNGDTVVAMIDGDCTVKILERTQEGTLLLPRSTNAIHRPIPVPADDERAQIVGKVACRIGYVS